MTRKQNSILPDQLLTRDSVQGLCFDGLPVAALARRFGTPLYVYSANGLTSQFRRLQSAFTRAKPLICFAMKANSNLGVLAHLRKLGAGTDIVSGGELLRAKRAGFTPEKIVFSGVGKRADEIELALRTSPRGVRSFNCESVEEALRISEVARRLRKRARVAFRFNPDVDAQTHSHISTGRSDDKFGLLDREILEVLQRRKEFPNIDFQGLSVHIGSQITSLVPLRQAFERVRELRREAMGLGLALPFLDLGGGLGIRYDDESPLNPVDYARLIEDLFFREEKDRPQTLVLEPGRWIAGESGILIARVELRKRRAGSGFVVLDAGMNDLVRPALYDAFHDIVPVRTSGSNSRVHVVGPVCESSDVFARDVSLPDDLDAGDLVVLRNGGAYGFSMSSHYNSRPRPAEILIERAKPRVVRAREKPADLWRGERV